MGEGEYGTHRKPNLFMKINFSNQLDLFAQGYEPEEIEEFRSSLPASEREILNNVVYIVRSLLNDPPIDRRITQMVFCQLAECLNQLFLAEGIIPLAKPKKKN